MLRHLAPWGSFHGMMVHKEGSWLNKDTCTRTHIHAYIIPERLLGDVLFYILRVRQGWHDSERPHSLHRSDLRRHWMASSRCVTLM